MKEDFLDHLAKLFVELHKMEPVKRERAIYFCIEQMITFAIQHEVDPPDSTEGMTEQ